MLLLPRLRLSSWLTSSWAFPDQTGNLYGRFAFSSLNSNPWAPPAPRSRCPSSWANPRCSIPFCWPTSEGRIARRLNWGSVSETNDLRPFKLLECSICVFFLAETILKPKDRLSYISWIKKETKFCFPTSRIMMATGIFMFGRFSEVHPFKKNKCLETNLENWYHHIQGAPLM